MAEEPQDKRIKLAATLATIAAQTANDLLDSSSDSTNDSDPEINSNSESESENINSEDTEVVAALVRRSIPKSSTFFDILEESDDIVKNL